MKLQILLHNAECGKKEFQLTQGVRPWGILMLISAGRYSLSFSKTGHTCTVYPHEISYIPPHTPFIRQVTEPIDFHQFTFQMQPDHPFTQALYPGKLSIPAAQVSAIERSLALSMMSPAYPELIRYELEHILTENYLFSGQSSAEALSEDIRRVIAYMEEHLAEKIDMDGLAALAFLSRTGLIWKFCRQLKSTPAAISDLPAYAIGQTTVAGIRSVDLPNCRALRLFQRLLFLQCLS